VITKSILCDGIWGWIAEVLAKAFERAVLLPAAERMLGGIIVLPGSTEPRVDHEAISTFLSAVFDYPTVQDKYLSIWTLADKKAQCFTVSDIVSAAAYPTGARTMYDGDSRPESTRAADTIASFDPILVGVDECKKRGRTTSWPCMRRPHNQFIYKANQFAGLVSSKSLRRPFRRSTLA
jgi:hypothetical protein